MKLLLKFLLKFLFLLLIITSGHINAQCDQFTQETLEDTKVSYFSGITKGKEGEIFIVVYSQDVEYTAVDENGAVYIAAPSSAYPGTLSINVGPLNQEKTFTIVAKKGECKYPLPDKVTITPQEDTKFILRKVDEYCENQGAIMFQVIGNGQNSDDYQYYQKMPDGTWSLPHDSKGISSLKAGNYELKAVHKTNNSEMFATIEIKNSIHPIVFDLIKYQHACEDKIAIKANVTSGLYPLYFSLYKIKTGGGFELVRSSQTSPIFEGIEKNTEGNTYQVRVNDFCGGLAGYGNAVTKDITLRDYEFDRFRFNQEQARSRYGGFLLELQEKGGCDSDYVNVTPVWESSFSSSFALDNTAMYPISFNFTVVSPLGKMYPIEILVNNKQELADKFYYTDSDNKRGYFKLKEDYVPQFPKEDGDWKIIDNSYTICGQKYPLPTFNDLSVIGKASGYTRYIHVDAPRDAFKCGRPYIRSLHVFNQLYYVLEKYPPCYKPEEDGFFKISRFGDKWVKGKAPAHGFVIVSSDKICVDGSSSEYQIRIVNDCGDEVLKSVTINAPLTEGGGPVVGGLNVYPYAQCGDNQLGLRIQTYYEAYGPYIQQIHSLKLESFTGNPSLLPADVQVGGTIPDHYRTAPDVYFIPKMPPGEYVFEANATFAGCPTIRKNKPVKLDDSNISITYKLEQKGCDIFLVPSNRKTISPPENVRWLLQWYDPIYGWVTASKEERRTKRFNLYLLSNDRDIKMEGDIVPYGKYRVVRAILGELGSLECIDSSTIQEFNISEAEDKPVKIKDVVGIKCSGNSYQVAVIVEGSKPPFTSKITNIGGVSTEVSSSDGSFFFNISPPNGNTLYVFRVEDACGNADTISITPGQFANFKITADKSSHCMGVKGVLSVPNLHPKISYKWYREDNPSQILSTTNILEINSLSTEDFNHEYKVDISSTFSQADVANCINKTLSYKLTESTSSIEDISGKGIDKTFCVKDETNNLKKLLFPDVNIDGGELLINGAIKVPHPYDFKLDLGRYYGRTLKVTYTIKNECGLTSTATANLIPIRPLGQLTVFPMDYVKCNGMMITSPTEIEDFIRTKFTVHKDAVFQWFERLSDTMPMTNFPITSDKKLYYRVHLPGMYCETKPHTIGVKFFKDPTNARLFNIEVCEGAPITDFKTQIKEILKIKNNNFYRYLKIYQYDSSTGTYTRLNDSYQIGSNMFELRYRYEDEDCTGAYGNITYTVKPRSQARDFLSLPICDNESPDAVTAYAMLRAKYPNATIKIYKSAKNTGGVDLGAYISDKAGVNLEMLERYFYVTEEIGKCVSEYSRFFFESKTKTTRPSNQTISVCAEATLSDVKALLTGNNVELYKDGVKVTDFNEQVSKTAVYQYTNTATDKCESLKALVTITLKPETTFVGALNVEVCEGMPIHQDFTLTGEFTGIGTAINLPSGLTASVSNKVISVSGTIGVGSYTYTLPLTGTCGAINSITASIEVKAKPQKPIIVEHTSSTCSSAQVLKINNYDSSAKYIGLPAGASVDSQGIIIGLPTDTTIQTFTGITSEIEGCSSELSDSFTIAPKLVTPEAPTGAAQQIICQGAHISDLVAIGTDIKWYSQATGGSALSSTTALTDNMKYYASQVVGTCESTDRLEVLVNFKPDNTVSTEIPLSICLGEIIHIEHSTSGATGIGRASGLPLGVTAIWSNDKIIISGTSTTVGTYNYSIPLTGGCGMISATGSITIKMVSSPNVVSVTQPSCSVGTGSVELSGLPSGTYTISYGSQNVTANSSVYTITNLPQGRYSFVVKSNGCTSEPTATITINEQPATPVAPVVSSNVVCPSTEDITFTATALSGHTLKWYDDATTTAFVTTAPIVSRNVTMKTEYTKYVSRVNSEGCESARVPVKIIVDDTDAPVITALNDLGIACNDTDVFNKIITWLNSATATDSCDGTPIVTTNYSVPTNICEQGEITVTFTSKDRFGNTSTKDAKIKFISAQEDDYRSFVVTSPTTGTVAVKEGSTDVNILSNDKIYGNPAEISNVIITQISSSNAGIKIEINTGKVLVASGVPSGEHELEYTICDKNNVTVCSKAKVKVKVFNTIDVVEDSNDEAIKGTTGGVVKQGGSELNIFGNDTYNGNSISNSSDRTNLSVRINSEVNKDGVSYTGSNPFEVDEMTGKVTVLPDTPSGTYTFTYTICEKVVPTNCDTAMVKIEVSNIVAKADSPASIKTKGGVIPSVFSNDELNGSPVTETNVNLTWDSSTVPSGFTPNSDGTITVPSGATPGTYNIKYVICDKSNPTICDEAEVRVVIEVPKPIHAEKDLNNEIIEGITGGVVKQGSSELNIFSNDTYGGNSIATYSDRLTNKIEAIINPTSITRDNAPYSGTNPFNLDKTTGKITVASGTPKGIYTFMYEIFNTDNPFNKGTALVEVIVAPTIEADSDDYSNNPIDSKVGGTLENILDNDSLDRVKIGENNSSLVTINIVDNGGLTGVTITSQGKVIVPVNSPVGNYKIKYTICDKQTGICSTAPADITIVINDIEAKDDISTNNVPGKIGGIVPGLNVLDNDTLNGGSVSTSSVRITSTSTKELEIEPNGSVRVKPGTPSGTYRISYRICELSNPSSCSNESIVTVEVVDNCELKIYNGLSNNEDGINDTFVIEGIECYPTNTLKIFNRWGVLIYEKQEYDNTFRGYSTGRMTINKENKLPTGTYYYILEYKDVSGNTQRKGGWLYLKNDN